MIVLIENAHVRLAAAPPGSDRKRVIVDACKEVGRPIFFSLLLIIAVAGVAAGTGIVMVVYLDEAFTRYVREGRIHKPEDVDAAVVEGAAARVRPLVMTVATTVLGLRPLLWEAGVGADVSARTAAPVVGGLWSCMVLPLLVLPAAYAMWRRHQVRVTMTEPALVVLEPAVT